MSCLTGKTDPHFFSICWLGVTWRPEQLGSPPVKLGPTICPAATSADGSQWQLDWKLKTDGCERPTAAGCCTFNMNGGQDTDALTQQRRLPCVFQVTGDSKCVCHDTDVRIVLEEGVVAELQL